MSTPRTPAVPHPPLTADTTATAADAATVVLAGRLDAVAAPDLQTVLTGLIATGRVRLTVDLTDVGFVDSAGLAVLVRARRETRAGGGGVELIAPRSDDALRVFRLTQFDQVFTMHPPATAGSGTPA